MSYIKFTTTKVKKAVKKFPNKDQKRIRLALREMETNPFTGDVVYLTDTDSHRKRLGHYRIIFEEVEDNVIRVYKITRRTSKTYR